TGRRPGAGRSRAVPRSPPAELEAGLWRRRTAPMDGGRRTRVPARVVSAQGRRRRRNARGRPAVAGRLPALPRRALAAGGRLDRGPRGSARPPRGPLRARGPRPSQLGTGEGADDSDARGGGRSDRPRRARGMDGGLQQPPARRTRRGPRRRRGRARDPAAFIWCARSARALKGPPLAAPRQPRGAQAQPSLTSEIIWTVRLPVDGIELWVVDE